MRSRRGAILFLGTIICGAYVLRAQGDIGSWIITLCLGSLGCWLFDINQNLSKTWTQGLVFLAALAFALEALLQSQVGLYLGFLVASLFMLSILELLSERGVLPMGAALGVFCLSIARFLPGADVQVVAFCDLGIILLCLFYELPSAWTRPIPIGAVFVSGIRILFVGLLLGKFIVTFKTQSSITSIGLDLALFVSGITIATSVASVFTLSSLRNRYLGFCNFWLVFSLWQIISEQPDRRLLGLISLVAGAVAAAQEDDQVKSGSLQDAASRAFGWAVPGSFLFAVLFLCLDPKLPMENPTSMVMALVCTIVFWFGLTTKPVSDVALPVVPPAASRARLSLVVHVLGGGLLCLWWVVQRISYFGFGG